MPQTPDRRPPGEIEHEKRVKEKRRTTARTKRRGVKEHKRDALLAGQEPNPGEGFDEFMAQSQLWLDEIQNVEDSYFVTSQFRVSGSWSIITFQYKGIKCTVCTSGASVIKTMMFERHYCALLIKCLLIRGCVEPNPGPGKLSVLRQKQCRIDKEHQSQANTDPVQKQVVSELAKAVGDVDALAEIKKAEEAKQLDDLIAEMKVMDITKSQRISGRSVQSLVGIAFHPLLRGEVLAKYGEVALDEKSLTPWFVPHKVLRIDELALIPADRKSVV